MRSPSLGREEVKQSGGVGEREGGVVFSEGWKRREEFEGSSGDKSMTRTH